MASNRPSFPSLYNPRFELDTNRHAPVQPNGKYLQTTHDIYLFTLYWSLILHTPLFLIAGTCASLFIALDPLQRIHNRPSLVTPGARTKTRTSIVPRRRFIAYAAVVFLAYGIVGAFLTVLGSTVVGFLIAGVYASGRFQVSTWVPFVWALLQSLVALTSMCSLIIEII